MTLTDVTAAAPDADSTTATTTAASAITVYSRPSCVQCSATYRALDRAGADYRVVNLDGDPEAMSYVVGLGHQQAPVVVIGEDHWSGFRPDRLAEALATLATPPTHATPDPRPTPSPGA